MTEQQELYARLAAPFERVYTREQAGQTFKYISGEQCISRLNEECGIKGWSFKVVEHGRDAEADEVWALVELTVSEDGVPTTSYGFGSQKIKRRIKTIYNRETREREKVRDHEGNYVYEGPLNIGQDMKGAMTDALKVAAKHVGVALYLYDKEESGDQGNGYTPRPQNQAPRQQQTQGNRGPSPAETGDGEEYYCSDCGNEIMGGTFGDGRPFTARQAAGWGTGKHGRPLCRQHLNEANQAKKRAEEANGSVPF